MKKLLFQLAFCMPFTMCVSVSSVFSQASGNFMQFDLVITEIMADPDPPNGLPVSEYCEIYNRSNHSVNLNGWVFFDGSARLLPAIQIDPGEYIIICDDSDTSLFSVFGKYVAISSISLTNSGEKISIRDPLGNPVDSVTFSDNWYGNSFKQSGGWSLEKVDLNFTCPVSSNWKPSEDTRGGTPGSINSVDGIIADDEPPVLLRSFCDDSLSVTLVFNEPLDPDNALQLQHYQFDSINLPISAAFCDINLQRVKLLLSYPITLGKTGTVIINGVTDCSGNEVMPGSMALFGIGDSSYNKYIVINEVLFNPFEGGNDFIELYNNGTGIVDLSELQLVSLNTESGIIMESIIIIEEPWLLFPGCFVILTENPVVVSSQYRTSFPFQFIALSDMPSMNVDEGFVGIAYHGELLDSFHYYENYHFELLEEVKGISLEKINPVFSSTDPASWHSAAQSAGYATPGLKNSQFSELIPGDNHVNIAPEIFSPDNDGIDDVLTITLKIGTPGYISNIWIYNSDGQVVFHHAKNTLLSTTDNFIWDGITDSGIKASAGIYVSVVEIFNLEGSVKKYRLPFVIASRL